MKKIIKSLLVTLMAFAMTFAVTACMGSSSEYTVTFIADGVTVSTVTYTEGNETISEPEVPAKEGYDGAWEEYTLSGDVTVNAVYTPIEYTVTFCADNENVATVTYTVENTEIDEPEVPVKEGYDGVWEEYTLSGNVTVNAVYTLKQYTVTFCVDNESVATRTYTVDNTVIDEPEVPTKEGYNGVWEEYTLSGNVTVNAVYTAIPYTLTFTLQDSDEPLVDPITYTVENMDEIVLPKVPTSLEREGYTVDWNKTVEELTLGGCNIYPVWTAIEYQVRFTDSQGEDVCDPIVYTIENMSDVEFPEVPNSVQPEGYTVTWDKTVADLVIGGLVVSLTTPIPNQYNVSFLANGGTFEGSENTCIESVTFDSDYEFDVIPTPAKIYQTFTGWVDEDGNPFDASGIWTVAHDVILTATYVNAVTFDSSTEVPSFIQGGGRATLSIVDGNGGKVLQATSENNEQGNVRIMMLLADMAKFFEDSNVQYLAFDLKLPENATTPVSSIMYHNLDQTNYSSYETGDPSKSGSQFDTTPTDAYKTYYMPRSVYEAWVQNNKTEGRFLNVQAGITLGASYWIDNIRPVTEDERTADLYSFETGSLRNMTNAIGFCEPNYNQFHFQITNVDASKAKFTNENVSDGMRAIQFTKIAGESVIMFNGNSDPSMETKMREVGYVSFDLYVPEGSDVKIKKYNQTWYGALKQGWNTVYEKVHETENELIRFIDSTASTYVIDNFRLLTEDEYNKAMLGFEAGGVLRDSNANDATLAGWTYYYAGWDKANNKASIQVTEGSSLDVLSNVRFATDIKHGGDYSLAFDKKAGWMDLKMMSDSKVYALLSEGFTFWIYSTTALNGTSANQIVNGYEGKLNGGVGINVEANTWTKITITADDIKGASRFLTLTGSTEGTIYIDDIEPLSTANA